HYLNRAQVLFTKSFIDLKDTYKYINDFFLSAIVTNDFKQENTWMQENLKHFVSEDFRYTVNKNSIRRFLLQSSGINLSCSIFCLLFVLIKGPTHLNIAGVFAILLVMFFVGGGINMVLFFNYYFYAKDKILIMSRGNDIFYYGDKALPGKYD